MKTSISIIVPVYKVERYIRGCLDSIVAQTFKEWECLLIDDGSPDSSGSICDEYAQRDCRFKVYHKTNGGVSSARNLGLDKANGEWITFIDSDDLIAPTFLDGLYAPIAQGEHVDFVHGGCTNWKDGKPADINQVYEYYVGDEPEIVFRDLRGLAVSKLFRLKTVRSWSNDQPLRFDEEMKIAEDELFTYNYLLQLKRYAFVPETGYYYRIDNINSATKTKVTRDYWNELLSANKLYSAVNRIISINSIPIIKAEKRLRICAKGYIEAIWALYYTNLSFSQKKAHLSNDFSQVFDILKYYKGSLSKNITASLLHRRLIFLCNLYCVSLFYIYRIFNNLTKD